MKPVRRNCPPLIVAERRLSLAILIILFSITSTPLRSQSFYFGKNKIQYVDFEWHIMHGEHVDIYFYPEEREIAGVALEEAEASYRFLEEKFRHHVFRRIPLILYSSHQDFEQTNVIPSFVSEGVGGVTEFLKGRVTLPFNGSIYDFRRVIRHEMVHVFEVGKLSSAYRMNKRFQAVRPPLWFTEGLAEHWSGEWNTLGDQVMRDLILHDRLTSIKDLWRFNGTFALYKIGQSIFHFLDERYGDERLVVLYHEMGLGRTFGEAFGRAYGISLDEAGKQWIWSLKQRYYPEVERLRDPGVAAERLTKDGANFHPVIHRGRDGTDRLYYISTRTGYVDVDVRPLDSDAGGEKTLLKGGREALFESLHPFASEIDVSGDGILAFSSKYHDRDALILLDTENGKIISRFQFKDIIGITSPAWSPDGDEIVFSGLTPAGYLDLFMLHLPVGELERLTNDRYSDRSPDFSPDGKRVVFSSDRTPYGERGFVNIFIMDLDDREIHFRTLGPWRDESPSWRNSPDGRILFVSDREGIRNAYATGDSLSVERLTTLSSGVYSPAWIPGEDGILFTAMDDQNFSIYRAKVTTGRDTLTAVAAADDIQPSWDWELAKNDTGQTEGIEKYKRDFSLDVAQGGVGFSSSLGSSQGARVMLTDMLGDKIIAIQLYNAASSTSDFLDSFSGSVAYLNRKQRLNYGLGAYHFNGDFFDRRYSETPFSERQYGLFFLLGYPFSKFTRVESSVLFSHSRRNDFVVDFSRNSYLVTNVFSLVRDNSLWLATGPIDGERINLTVGITNDLTRAQPQNTTFQADIRKYFRTSLRTAYSVRLMGRISEGALPERAIIGGSWSLRGYPRFSIIGTRVILLNQEWRFPLLNRLILRFPFGDLAFPPFQGAIFFDAGNAWDKTPGYPGLLGSLGLGVRFSLGGPLVLRFDFARRTDFHAISNDTKFDFFFGYNY